MLSRTPRAITGISISITRTSKPATTTTIRSLLPFTTTTNTTTRSPTSRLPAQPARSFHISPVARKGIQPDSSDPKPPNPQSHGVAGVTGHTAEASPLTESEYHDYAEHYFNVLLAELERAQEDGSEVEAEYSAGVLNVTVPGVGTYVLNKQPPNRQIWLSSPISGPKRYDWVIEGDRMYEKQDSRPFTHGQWIYLRDGSHLTELLNSELSLSLPQDVYGEKVDS